LSVITTGEVSAAAGVEGDWLRAMPDANPPNTRTVNPVAIPDFAASNRTVPRLITGTFLPAALGARRGAWLQTTLPGIANSFSFLPRTAANDRTAYANVKTLADDSSWFFCCRVDGTGIQRRMDMNAEQKFGQVQR
jgi:hypothetical protein